MTTGSERFVMSLRQQVAKSSKAVPALINIHIQPQSYLAFLLLVYWPCFPVGPRPDPHREREEER